MNIFYENKLVRSQNLNQQTKNKADLPTAGSFVIRKLRNDYLFVIPVQTAKSERYTDILNIKLNRLHNSYEKKQRYSS